ncbi:dihydrodipicolinate reductase [Mycobacterium avium subsp. hominissuis]|nr:dihydrodipicolinate reductase [Mycobacterium avium subsp. hominissuis]MCG3244985.1 dihydrodipicolinate reductase [Mycobacterium avium subsp. hominissuis]
MSWRVCVCYTGSVGSQVIRLLSGDPRFEIAGVLVHHAEKAGRDVGELVGIGPIGITATRDVAALVDLRADCALWHGLSWEPAVVARLLEAGTNVYSGMGGWYVPGSPEHELLAAACERGGATLAGGGSIPGLISDVLPLFVSGYSGKVRRLRARQINYVASNPSAMLLEHGLGMGVEPDPAATTSSEVDELWQWGIGQSARIVAAGLDLPLTDVRLTKKEFAPAREDLVLSPSGLEVRRGTTAGVRWTFTAFTGEVPFFEVVNEQTVMLGLGPGWRATADEPNWRVEIDGSPSIACTIDLPSGQDDPVNALNAARAVNFIPRLMDADPGCATVLDLPSPRAATLQISSDQ